MSELPAAIGEPGGTPPKPSEKSRGRARDVVSRALSRAIHAFWGGRYGGRKELTAAAEAGERTASDWISGKHLPDAVSAVLIALRSRPFRRWLRRVLDLADAAHRRHEHARALAELEAMDPSAARPPLRSFFGEIARRVRAERERRRAARDAAPPLVDARRFLIVRLPRRFAFGRRAA